jgi:hypothetical protein
LFDFLKRKTQTEKRTVINEIDTSRVLFKCNFNDDFCGWQSRGTEQVKVSLTSEEKHSGNSCLKITGRNENWHGASVDISKYISDGQNTYEAMVWVKLPDNADSSKVYLSLEVNSKIGGVVFPYYEQWDDYNGEEGILSKYRLPVGGTHDSNNAVWETAYPKGYVTDDGWVLLHGKVKINHAEHFRAYVYIETNPQGSNNDIYIDDFVLLRGSV